MIGNDQRCQSKIKNGHVILLTTPRVVHELTASFRVVHASGSVEGLSGKEDRYNIEYYTIRDTRVLIVSGLAQEIRSFSSKCYLCAVNFRT
jgi:hypothetical protein